MSDDEEPDYYQDHYYEQRFLNPEPQYWLNDSESDDEYSRVLERRGYGQSNVFLSWQKKLGQDSPIQDKHLSSGESINLIHFLLDRERNEKFTKSNKSNALLLFSLMPRWSTVPRIHMLMDAKMLLGRELYCWEGAVLLFLRSFAMKKTRQKQLRQDSLLYLATEGIVPVTFIDIVNILMQAGLLLNATDDSGDDLLLFFLKRYELHEDSADFFEFFIKRGYHVKKNGQEIITVLCDSCSDRGTSNAKFRVLKMLFDYGLKLEGEAIKRDVVQKLTRSAVLRQANQAAVNMLSLLFERGCHASMSVNSLHFPSYSPRTPNRFKCLLKMVDVLLENGAQISDSPAHDPQAWLSLINNLLDSAKSEPSHASMLEFITKYATRGLFDIQVTMKCGKNAVMSFCEKYKNADLSDIVRFLCISGLDVNAIDSYGRNALFYLTDNEPVCRQAIYETVRVLIQLGINVNQTDCWHGTALARFLSADETDIWCCYYKYLKRLNDSFYWEILELLLDAGACVSQQANSRSALLMTFDRLREYMVWTRCSTCKGCFKSVSTENESLATLGTTHSSKAYNFIKRLIQAGALDCRGPSYEYNNLLHIVCQRFEGEQLVSLVKLLCEHGVDVNAKIKSHDCDESTQIDAIDLLVKYNKGQAHLVNRLIAIMKPYGYQGDD